MSQQCIMTPLKNTNFSPTDANDLQIEICCNEIDSEVSQHTNLGAGTIHSTLKKRIMYLKVKDLVEITEAIEALGRENVQYSEEGAKAYSLLCMKFGLYVI